MAPLGEEHALEFLIDSSRRVSRDLATLGFAGLLHMRVVAPETIITRLGDEGVERLSMAAPSLALDSPNVIGPLFLELLNWSRDHPKALASLIDAIARAHRTLGDDDGTPFGPQICAQHAASVREVDQSNSEVQLAVIKVFAEVGAIGDLVTLSPLTEGFFRSGVIKDAAREAMRRIKERQGVRDETGALALSEQTIGGLALTDGDGS